MKAICINNCDSRCLTKGKIYDIKDDPLTSTMYVVLNDEGNETAYYKRRFSPVLLLEGWTYCTCGALTKNTLTSLCCDCLPKDAL